MARNNRRPLKGVENDDFDISLDPLFSVGKGDKQRHVSAAYILLHGQFRDALEGKPSGVAAMLKIMKINARERERQPELAGATAKARHGKAIIDANPALQILRVASGSAVPESHPPSW